MTPEGAVSGRGTAALALRPAHDSDISALVALERAAFTDPWNASAFRALLQSSSARITVAQIGAAVVGYCAVLRAADQADLANVAVAAPVQGRGIGRALLTAALDSAARDGVATMFLEVRESNAAARHLYADLGFVVVGRRRGYYRQPEEDALLMQWCVPDGRGGV